MIANELVSPGVYVASEPIVQIGLDDLMFMVDELESSQRGRVRLCCHRGTEDALHEMFIAFRRGTYVQPNFHHKDESLHILYGEATNIFFDSDGLLTDLVALGTVDSGRSVYCRVPAGVYHTLLVESEVLVVHEVTSGPFRRSDTVFAPWAPGEDVASAQGGDFLDSLARLAKASRSGADSSADRG